MSIEQANALPPRWVGMASHLSKRIPSLSTSLRLARLPVLAENYAGAAILSALTYGVLFTIVFGAMGFYTNGGMALSAIQLGIVGGLVSGVTAMGLHLLYPLLLARQSAQKVDQGLIFTLRSLQIQVNSGVSLYDAMTNVAKSEYGIISDEFGHVVQEINAGVNEATALERLALRTDSPFLKKTIWQLVTNIRAGSPISSALESIVNALAEFQSRAIKNYAGELNMWILLYLLIAAALPTIGITFMVILSSIGGSSISPETIYLTIGGAFGVQIVLIGFIGSRAPRGYA
jgi:pilus assembly protein TadC